MAIVLFLIHNLTGVESVKDSEGKGWKISVSDAYFVEKVGEFLESDRRYTCEKVAQDGSWNVKGVGYHII